MTHSIQTEHISINALKVLKRLSGAGFQAFLVGGSVRDLLLGLHPKDFDVATDAHPDEVRELFRNSRHIGKRFKILHIRFGREIIEVATFRAHHDRESHEDNHADSGMILRDNVYGSFEDDVSRRDFTINALYYQPDEQKVQDLTGGIGDLEKRVIRLIGDPETRYREDPVRMIRAVRFAAKLNFRIDPDTAAPIRSLSHLLNDVPPARLFEEVLKLFMAGHAEQTFVLLKEYRLLEWLFPETVRALSPVAERLIALALRSTDERVRDDKPVTPAFLFAALLWPQLQAQCQSLQANGHSLLGAFHITYPAIINHQSSFTSLPRRYAIPMKEIWDLQFRLHRRQGRRVWTTFNHKRFRAAYDFLLLREAAGDKSGDLGQWWTEFQEHDASGKEAMIKELSDKPKKKPRNSKRSK
ncbi:MAG: polynucleotide adenylyltransferase PcnB [Gammaproteobacteria bacterium]|nr:polynucleotide adenylyltransferase PcnB [Gammaproteobacteria bacterium]